MKRGRFTGLLDAKLRKIHEGDWIWAGMRRGDTQGWTLERVIRGKGDDPWMLADPETGETMQMQWDQELRGLARTVDTKFYKRKVRRGSQ